MNRASSPGAGETGPTGRATIGDVARVALASKTSVSRYLSGNVDALSGDLRTRIEQAIEQLGYRPSPIARSLKGGRTGLIGMVVADVENPYSVAVLHGAETACQQHGFALLVSNSGGDAAMEQKLIAALLSYRIEGLIVNAAGPRSDLFRDVPGGFPVVLVDRKPAGCAADFVGLDNIAAMDAAVRHLVDEGFNDLAVVIQPVRGISTREERAAGFLSAVRRRPGCRGEVFEIDQADPVSIDRALRQFLSIATAGPKAVIAASGLVTLRLVQSLARLQLHVPQDLGLVGFDELEWSSLVPPGITTFGQPTQDIGAAAVGRLLSRLSGDSSNARDTIFTGRLQPRGSSSGRLARRPSAP